MNQYEMVALIVAVVAGAGVLKHAVTLKDRRKDDEPSGDSQAREMSEDRLKGIEQRLQVLERIVTSDGYDLKQQFKDLEKDQ